MRDSLGFVASKKSRAAKNPRGARGRIDNASRYWNRRGAQPSACSRCCRPSDVCESATRTSARTLSASSGASARCSGIAHAPPGPYEFLSGDHHVIGNRMRLTSSSEITLDERWRSILTPEEAETVRRLTSRYRQAFGY